MSGIFDNLNMPWDDWGKSFHALMAQSMEAFGETSWEMLRQSFEASAFKNDGGVQDWWIVVIGGTLTVTTGGEYSHQIEYPGMLNVMVAAMLPILVIFVVLQVIMSLVRASTAGMLRAFGGAILAVPATYVLGGLIFVALRGFDYITEWILDTGSGEDENGVAAIYRLMGLMYDPKANDGEGGVLLDANYQAWQLAGRADQPGQIILPWLILLVLTILCLCLMVMMLFRVIAILIMTMFTPVAVFSLSFEAAKSVFMKWMSTVLGLLFAKPIAAAIVMFGMSMASVSSDWVQMIAGAVLVVIAAAMPLMMLGLVNFMTPDGHRAVENQMMASAGGTKRVVGGGMRSGSRTIISGGRVAARTGKSVAGGVSKTARVVRGGRRSR